MTWLQKAMNANQLCDPDSKFKQSMFTTIDKVLQFKLSFKNSFTLFILQPIVCNMIFELKFPKKYDTVKNNRLTIAQNHSGNLTTFYYLSQQSYCIRDLQIQSHILSLYKTPAFIHAVPNLELNFKICYRLVFALQYSQSLHIIQNNKVYFRMYCSFSFHNFNRVS